MEEPNKPGKLGMYFLKQALQSYNTERLREIHAVAGQLLIERDRDELPPRFMIGEE